MSILRTDKIAGLDSVSAITGSVFFGGQGFLRGPKDDDFQFASGSDFTIEAWVNASHFNSNSTIAATWDQTGAANGDQWLLAISDAGLLRFAWSPERTDDYWITGGTITKDTWHHVALTRSGNTFRIFLDGTQTATGTNSSTNSSNSFLQIGRYAEVSTSYWYGYISNFRICKGHAVYKKAFTPPTRQLTVHFNSPGDETVLLCCQSSQDAGMDATGKILTPTATTVNSAAPQASTFVPDVGNDHIRGTVLEGGTAFSSLNYMTLPRGTTDQRYILKGRDPNYQKLKLHLPFVQHTQFDDYSPASPSITANYETHISSKSGVFENSAVLFSRSAANDWIAISDSNDLDLGTDDFTIECWFMCAGGGTDGNLIQKGYSAGTWSYIISFKEATDSINFYATTDGTNFDIVNGTSFGTTILPNIWYHVAVCRNGNTFSYYINGQKGATEDTSSASLYNSSIEMRIKEPSGFGATEDVFFQDVRLYKGVAKYSESFTPQKLAEAGAIRHNTDSNKIE